MNMQTTAFHGEANGVIARPRVTALANGDELNGLTIQPRFSTAGKTGLKKSTVKLVGLRPDDAVQRFVVEDDFEPVRDAGLVEDDAVSGGDYAWSNCDAARVSDGNEAYAIMPAGATGTKHTHYLKFSKFGFNLPVGASVAAIKVELRLRATHQWEPQRQDVYAQLDEVKLMYGGIYQGSAETSEHIDIRTHPGEYLEVGGRSSYSFQIIPTGAQVNGDDFGFGMRIVMVANVAQAKDFCVMVEHVRVTAYYFTNVVSSNPAIAATNAFQIQGPDGGMTTDPHYGPNFDWVDVANAKTEDGTFASITTPYSASPYSANYTKILCLTGFGFSIPADAKIVGIRVAPKAQHLNSIYNGRYAHTAHVVLVNGTNSGDCRVLGGKGVIELALNWPLLQWPEALAWFDGGGGPSHYWEEWDYTRSDSERRAFEDFYTFEGLTPAMVNDPDFGVGIQVLIQNWYAGPDSITNVDCLRVWVYYIEPGDTYEVVEGIDATDGKFKVAIGDMLGTNDVIEIDPVTKEITTGGDINLGGNKVTNVGPATAGTDAINKNDAIVLVNAAVTGLAAGKQLSNVRVAIDSYVDIATGGLGTYDDIALHEDDRVVLFGQPDESENGIYIVHAGAWVRADDMPAASAVDEGAWIISTEGTDYANSGFYVTAAVASVGADPMYWERFTGTGSAAPTDCLKLNTSNGPLVGDLTIEKVAPILRLTDSTLDSLNSVSLSKVKLKSEAKLQNAVSKAEVYTRSALALNEAALDTYIIMGHMDALADAQHFSISYWVNPATDIGGGADVGHITVNSTYSLGYRMIRVGFTAGNKPFLELGVKDAGHVSAHSSVVCPKDHWYHIVWTFDGTQSAANRLKVYINDVKEDLSISASTTMLDIGDTYMGCTYYTNGGGGVWNQFFKGAFDEPRFYSTTLGSSRIKEIYDGAIPPGDGEQGIVPDAGIIAGYHLDDATGTTVEDYVGTLDGTITGTSYDWDSYAPRVNAEGMPEYYTVDLLSSKYPADVNDGHAINTFGDPDSATILAGKYLYASAPMLFKNGSNPSLTAQSVSMGGDPGAGFGISDDASPTSHTLAAFCAADGISNKTSALFLNVEPNGLAAVSGRTSYLMMGGAGVGGAWRTSLTTNPATITDVTVAFPAIDGHLAVQEEVIHKISRVLNIDATSIGTTTLFTMPHTSGPLVITSAVIIVSTGTGITVPPTLGIGRDGVTDDDIFASTLLTGLEAGKMIYIFTVTSGAVRHAIADDVIKLGIDTGATATSMTIAVDLFGYFL